jgi:hypothetical protein
MTRRVAVVKGRMRKRRFKIVVGAILSTMCQISSRMNPRAQIHMNISAGNGDTRGLIPATVLNDSRNRKINIPKNRIETLHTGKRKKSGTHQVPLSEWQCAPYSVARASSSSVFLSDSSRFLIPDDAAQVESTKSVRSLNELPSYQ